MTSMLEEVEKVKARIPALNFNDKVYETADLTPHEQIYVRGKPRRYLDLACELLDAINGKVIVEIGCMRTKLTHPLSEFHPACCNEGHSTLVWCQTGAQVFSVDVDWRAVRKAKRHCREFKNCRIYRKDGIKFLEHFRKKIDLLYLDAWDTVANTPYAENHLIAYLKAKDKLSDINIISIDDTDVAKGGKGRLLIPVLKAEGYDILVQGRQTIALKMP